MDYDAKPIDETLFTFENLCDSIEEIFNNAEKINGAEAADQLAKCGVSLTAVCEKISEKMPTYDFATVLYIRKRMVRIKDLISPYMI